MQNIFFSAYVSQILKEIRQQGSQIWHIYAKLIDIYKVWVYSCLLYPFQEKK